ncbi:vomeronasal type-2 receptor 116-like [Peromyscus californicus insignis]|uniref:vomeronasal type-2 receptor 116-like n=1 Tax=Peromyscus californicus insignis TaxID=564181 RepID=UPI0022A79A27|nr:vomeronasal type-2 receptor 116-like [Peromyscus californicus insignis]
MFSFLFLILNSLQLSFGPFDTILSDRGQFSSLYQTAPNDSSLSLGIVSLMIHFSWTWVGLVLIDNHKGIQILSDLRGEMHRNRVCIAFMKTISENLSFFNYAYKGTLELLMISSANVIIIYYDNESLLFMIINAMNLLITWKVWVMNSQLDVGTVKEPFPFDSFHGTLLFANHHDEISDFRKFMHKYTPSNYPEDHYLALIWNTFFNCSLSVPGCEISGNCLSNASLELFPSNLWNMDMTEEGYNIYNSVYAVAHSLHEMSVKQVQIQPHVNGEDKARPWEVMSLPVYFTNSDVTYCVFTKIRNILLYFIADFTKDHMPSCLQLLV